MTTIDWKKVAARRGYWYRKTRRKLIELTEKSINISHSLFMHNNHYYNAGLLSGRFQGRNEMQVERDAYREKYYSFIEKFNSTHKEKEDLHEKLDKENKNLYKKLNKVIEENEDLREKLEMAIGDIKDLQEILESITEDPLQNPDMVIENLHEYPNTVNVTLQENPNSVNENLHENPNTVNENLHENPNTVYENLHKNPNTVNDTFHENPNMVNDILCEIPNLVNNMYCGSEPLNPPAIKSVSGASPLLLMRQSEINVIEFAINSEDISTFRRKKKK